MENKEVKLLQNQIDKLKNKEFDLEAWKEYTIVIIGRIFGEDSHKIKLIRDIEYEHSSWSLRDTSGNSAIEACKKLGTEILEASIAELENFGSPKTGNESSEEIINIIRDALQYDLKGSQYKELNQIMKSKMNKEQKQVKIAEKLISYDTEAATIILSHILSEPRISKS